MTDKSSKPAGQPGETGDVARAQRIFDKRPIVDTTYTDAANKQDSWVQRRKDLGLKE